MTTKEQRRRDWNARIADFRASGLTMSAWCAANQFSIDQLKYWLYKAKRLPSSITSEKSVGTSRFIPLTVAEPSRHGASSVVVHVGQARIELRSGFDPQLLREIVHALQSPC